MTAAPAPGSVVLLYHRFGSPLVRSTVRGQYVHPTLLRWQLQALQARGYRAVSLADAVAHPDVPGTYCVTIDDGYTSVARALPVFRELDVPVTLFMVAGAIGGSNLWDQAKGDRVEPLYDAHALRELAAEGVEIGSHTLTHPMLTRLSDEALRREIVDSRQRLEDLLGRAVTAFSYPYGDMDARVRDLVVAAGYTSAVATTLAFTDRGMDPFAIPRMNMRWNTIGPELTGKLRRAARNQGRAMTCISSK